MRSSTTTLLAICSLALMLTTCGAGASSELKNAPDPAAITPGNAFNAYWYQGKGEVSRYALSQARYGELRSGDAIVVFVTEDFLTKEQVKYEGRNNGPRTGVLKFNLLERFNTGIYDYSLMTSVFSPVDGAPALKTTCSIQDWCGQAYMQLNHRENGYEYELRSYFEQEGDKNGAVGKVILEDAVWNQIRMDPNKLPKGEVTMLPSTRYVRLLHRSMEGVKVRTATIAKNDTSTYRMEFTTLDRTVEIQFGTADPHTIFGWSETRKDGFGEDAKTLTTTAVLTHQVMEPYWGMHANNDDSERERLGLPLMPVR